MVKDKRWGFFCLWAQGKGNEVEKTGRRRIEEIAAAYTSIPIGHGYFWLLRSGVASGNEASHALYSGSFWPAQARRALCFNPAKIPVNRPANRVHADCCRITIAGFDHGSVWTCAFTAKRPVS